MQERPNVVVIVSDTFRRDHLGAYGNQEIKTPNLDAFARSSVVFDQHRVSSFPDHAGAGGHPHRDFLVHLSWDGNRCRRTCRRCRGFSRTPGT